MMLGLIVLMAAQAAAPAAAAKPSPAEQVRQALAAKGMSAAGIQSFFAVQAKHVPTLRGIIQRGAAAEAAIRASLAKRPVDVAAFATATNARAEAASALQREGAAVSIEQMRALSPADRNVLAQAVPQTPAAAPKR